MKPRNLLLAIATLTMFAFSSCKKVADTTAEVQTTFDLAGDQAVASNLTQDANDMLNDAAEQDARLGGRGVNPVESSLLPPCATVTVTGAFPNKLIVIDFGTICTFNGVTRSGKINISLSDSIKKPGSVANITFTNYVVNGHKKEGELTLTNTSVLPGRSVHRKMVNGKITRLLDGKFWLHNGEQDITQTAGVGTPQRADDAFSIEGNSTVTNSAGQSRTTTILEALQKKVSCHFIDKGKIKVQGPNHFAIIDFGNGTCDNKATLSIDGNPPRDITLH